MICRNEDEKFMGLALDQARYAALCGEVPVGAVLVQGGKILARAANSLVYSCDPVGHAEVRALRLAGRQCRNYRLVDTTLYVTLEPCAMCAAALVHARIKRLVFGATDPKAGGVVSVYAIGTDRKLNHCFEVCGGVRGEECSHLLRDFFQKRRRK